LWMTNFSEEIDRIGGYHFYHYGSCKTRLWLFHRNVEVGMDNEHIRVGKHLDKVTYDRNKKKLTIPGLCAIDFISGKDGLEVHEIKKGSEISEAHRYQVLFYLEVMKSITGMDLMGFIHYPETKRVVEVQRDPEVVEKIFNDIVATVRGDCPAPYRIPICHGCSYEEMCWA
jgi:CRISPR-associated exonuclease Cas4